MPSLLTYPGVYIEEPPSGVHPIVGVATSIAAFVGRAKRGPVGKPTVINSYADFERQFGGMWIESSLGYAVRDFYLNGGNQAVIVRLFSGPRTQAQAQAQTAAELVASAAAAAAVPAAAGPAPTAATVAAAASGAVAAASAPGAAATSAAKDVAKAADDASKVTTPKATPTSVVDAATGAVAAAVAKAAAAAPSSRAQLAADTLVLEAAFEGTWGNGLRARIDWDMSPRDLVGKAFNLTVRDPDANVTELFRNVTLADGPRQVANVLKNESRLARVATLPTALPKAHDKPKPGEDIWKLDTLSSGVGTGPKGDDGSALSQGDFVGPGKDATKQGLYALRDADLFNLLCIPPYVESSNDIEYSTLLPSALKFCAERRAMMLVDPPSAWHDKDFARDNFSSPTSPFAGDPNNKNAAFFSHD